MLPDVVPAFEDTQRVKLVPSFCDGNPEACNKLRDGRANKFVPVQADGFWPQLYFREGLIRAVDYTKVTGTAGYLPEFAARTFKVLTDPTFGAKVGFPFCWGAYGITYDAAVSPPIRPKA